MGEKLKMTVLLSRNTSKAELSGLFTDLESDWTVENATYNKEERILSIDLIK